MEKFFAVLKNLCKTPRFVHKLSNTTIPLVEILHDLVAEGVPKYNCSFLDSCPCYQGGML